jgi:dethiobiotin synthetase
VVSAALLHRYRRLTPLRYWKPIQTGIEQDDDTAAVRRLAASAEREILAEGVRLPRPLSPHLAAKLSGAEITLDALITTVEAQPEGDAWIVEGAGGVLVPVNAGQLMADLISRLQLPALIVARSGLGTINHTLLTIEALRARSIAIAGVVLVGAPNRENSRAIEHYGQVVVVGELPVLDPLAAEPLARWAEVAFDPDGHIMKFLQ